MRCNACWREARKIAVRTERSSRLTYKTLSHECPHGHRHTPTWKPEITYTVNVGPLTPLHEIFPDRSLSA